MEYLARRTFPTFDTGEVDEYLHHVLGPPGKNRKGSTPYADKRNRKRKNKPKRK